MDTKYISATDLKRKTSEIINMVYYEKKIAVIERFGKSLVKMTPIENSKKNKEDIEVKLNRYFAILPEFPKITKERKFRKKNLSL